MASISPLEKQKQPRWPTDTLGQPTVWERVSASKPPSPPDLQTTSFLEQNRNKSVENSSSTTTGTYRSRKVACDVCRERKARCDRNQPCCGRCNRLGNKCKYSPPERQDTGKIDVSQALETLHSRLAQAEAKLAVQQQQPQLDLNRTTAWTGPFPRLDFDFDFSQTNTSRVDNGAMICPVRSDDSLYPYANIDLHDPMVAQAIDDREWQGFAVDADVDMGKSSKQSSTSSSWEPQCSLANSQSLGNHQMLSTDLTEPCPPQVMLTLFQQYFDVLHPLIPILERDRFMGTLKDSSTQYSLQFKSLTYAVAMLGASVSEKHTYLEEELYSYSRTYLEMTETQDEGSNFWTLEALQTCVLTIWYEFKGTGFARAWMSLGRAIRLGKMMGLHRIDRNPNEPAKEKCTFSLPLAETEDLVELEERRRTFWVLFIFDAYASVRTGSPMSICESEISTALPAPSFQREGNSLTAMPSLKNSSKISETNLISPFAGIVLMISLHSRCLHHFEASKEQDVSGDQSYPFWVQHYRLDKKLDECDNGLISHINADIRQDEPLTLSLRLNMCAVRISLHEVAIFKAQEENLPTSLIVESETRLMAAANEMVEDLRIVPNMDAKKFKMWQHTSTFLMWPLSKAAEVLLKQIKAPQGDIENTVASLQLVRNVMGDFRDPSGHWKGVMSEVTALLAEMRNGPKKRKLGRKSTSSKDGTMER